MIICELILRKLYVRVQARINSRAILNMILARICC